MVRLHAKIKRDMRDWLMMESIQEWVLDWMEWAVIAALEGMYWRSSLVMSDWTCGLLRRASSLGVGFIFCEFMG